MLYTTWKYTLKMTAKVNGENIEQEFIVYSKHEYDKIAHIFSDFIKRHEEPDILCYYDNLAYDVVDLEPCI